MFTETQVLKYEKREDDIAVIAKALDLLGHGDVPAAIEVLMEYRNNLIESQHPRTERYIPSLERVR